jgi:alanyl-tRNA synthetase
LRFDFSHYSKLTEEEIIKIENIVNRVIRDNIAREEYREISYDEAINMGALAFFDEKYGDKVRVISYDKDYSIELCGGTHVKATER